MMLFWSQRNYAMRKIGPGFVKTCCNYQVLFLLLKAPSLTGGLALFEKVCTLILIAWDGSYPAEADHLVVQLP